MDTSNPGNDRSLTADEAQAWKLLERSLRLRPRLRYRAAALCNRLVHSRLVLAGLFLTLSAGLAALAVLLPQAAGLIVAVTVASIGVVLALVGGMCTMRPWRRSGPRLARSRVRRRKR